MEANWERLEQRVLSDREELVERLSRAIREDGRIEPIKGLYLNRASARTELAYGVTELFLRYRAGEQRNLFGGRALSV